MRFMIEIFAEQMEIDPRPGMWEKYPFEVNGDEVWIKPEDLTSQQLNDMECAIREFGERKMREAAELERFNKLRTAGISGVIDGGKI